MQGVSGPESRRRDWFRYRRPCMRRGCSSGGDPGSGGPGRSAWSCADQRAGRRSGRRASRLPASSIVVMKVWRNMWGCALVIRMPAVSASRRRRRVAAWRSIRAPAAVEKDRPAHAGACRSVDGTPDRWGSGDQDDLGALAAHAQHPVPVLFAEVGDVRAGGLEDRRPSSPSIATSAKSQRSADWRAAVSRPWSLS
jgi:hypothetical protein